LASCAARAAQTSRPSSTVANSPTGCANGSPSFAAEVQPILELRCFHCHTQDGPAAEEHDFSRAETLHAQMSEIKDAIISGSMPPRSPLDQGEAQSLLRWVTCASESRH